MPVYSLPPLKNLLVLLVSKLFSVGRETLETRTIKDVTIPAGSVVVVAIYGLMRDEDIFPNADKFIPER